MLTLLVVKNVIKVSSRSNQIFRWFRWTENCFVAGNCKLLPPRIRASYIIRLIFAQHKHVPIEYVSVTWANRTTKQTPHILRKTHPPIPRRHQTNRALSTRPRNQRKPHAVLFETEWCINYAWEQGLAHKCTFTLKIRHIRDRLPQKDWVVFYCND